MGFVRVVVLCLTSFNTCEICDRVISVGSFGVWFCVEGV